MPRAVKTMTTAACALAATCPTFQRGVAEGDAGLLVNPEMAQLVEEETPPEAIQPPTDSGVHPSTTTWRSKTPSPPAPRGPKRVAVTKDHAGRNFPWTMSICCARRSSANLRDDGGEEITVEITIRAHKADGFSEARLVRSARTAFSSIWLSTWRHRMEAWRERKSQKNCERRIAD